ncbi:uncharacterized protein LOC130989148 isoform X2 [Salvia miltiorrhiza]|uniref:uncharacterized protein LOC130989148 isoform X2 n=1 Tax=Salvia miltiorrhiza TaxID=226208 RepID=UPI0025AD8C68|nr:uncharacterized protein LOC130989148 isoform X2 [Salvia miltiorrhiza]
MISFWCRSDGTKMIVHMFDSLYNRIRDVPWKAAVDNAMSIYNANKGKKFKNSAKWENIKAPKQPGGTECGFFVMRYMKEIVQGFEKDANISLPSLLNAYKYILSYFNVTFFINYT